jgi:hypothetical protein
MTNNIEALAVAWELRTAIDGRTSQTIFAAKTTAEREAEAVRSSYGHHAFTRIALVSLRRVECDR